jgi:nicotinate-nucleotide pyrophosphorylase (carboxylating)
MNSITQRDQLIKELITQAITEDKGTEDITTSNLFVQTFNVNAEILVKQNCLLAGVEVAEMVCEVVDKNIHVDWKYKDGAIVEKNTTIGILNGPMSSILLAERTLLNFMQRMSGIATKTKEFVELISPYKTKILDTRKTTPNFRIFEKWAVSIGGGVNHRFGLYDAILVKDNHIEACGDVAEVIKRLETKFSNVSNKPFIIIEVKNEEEFLKVIDTPIVDRILLDNMTANSIESMLLKYPTNKPIEISGGINKKNIIEYAKIGVDYVSIGALTHHIESIDISLNIK